MLCRSREVVEHVLLVGEPASVMPSPAIFRAASQIGDCKHAAELHPGKTGHREIGLERHGETAIPVQQCRMGRVEAWRHVASMDHEHGHAGITGALEEHLLDNVVLRVEGQRRGLEDLAFARSDIVAIERRRPIEARVAVEGLGDVRLAAKAADASDAGEFDGAHELEGLGIDRHLGRNIAQALDNEMATDVTRVLDRRCGLGHHVLTHGRRRQIDRDDALVGCLIVGEHEEARTLIADIAMVEVEAIEEHDRRTHRTTRIVERDHLKAVAVGPAATVDHEPGAVVADAGVVADLGTRRILEDERVFCLRGTDPMEMHGLVQIRCGELFLRCRLRIARVVET